MKQPKIYLCSKCGSRKVYKSFWVWLFSFNWIHIVPWCRWHRCKVCKRFTKFELSPKYSYQIKTWEDKCNWENAHHPGHAEGYPCYPGAEILILNDKGEEEVISFNPRTLRLDTNVIDWYYWRRE